MLEDFCANVLNSSQRTERPLSEFSLVSIREFYILILADWLQFFNP